MNPNRSTVPDGTPKAGEPSHTPEAATSEAGTSKPFPALFFVLWIALVVAGMAMLFSYAFKGAIPHATAAMWPLANPIETPGDKPTLLLFVHPLCPCTAATIAELNRVLSDYPRAFQTHVVLALPEDAAEAWRDSPNVRAASRLPGVTIKTDPDGALSADFGPRASGTVLVYADSGERLFSGGLTASRGHEGVSTGTLALRAIAAGHAPARTTSPVFGCDLVAPAADVRGSGI